MNLDRLKPHPYWGDSGGGGFLDKEKTIDVGISELCEKLGIPLYGFFLYHSGHSRIKLFLQNNFDFLDNATGDNLFILSVVKTSKSSRIHDDFKSEELKAELKKLRSENKETLNEDLCFKIAKHLNIKRTELPVLIIYKNENGYIPQARLSLKDNWFPKNSKDKDTELEVKDWMLHLFDCMDEIFINNNRDNSIVDLRKEFEKLEVKNNRYRPIFRFLKTNLLPIAKAPFSIISAIPNIVEKFGQKYLEEKIEKILPIEIEKEGE